MGKNFFDDLELLALGNRDLSLDEAMELLEVGKVAFLEKKYKISLGIFCILYDKGFWQTELVEFIIESFHRPNEREFESCYERNRAVLNKYEFWRGMRLPAFSEIKFKTIFIEESMFLVWDENDAHFSDMCIFKTDVFDQQHFFQDLKKPILVKNEFNTGSWEYLNDNIRCSKDFGADNHIYMYYDNLEKFYMFLQTTDITMLLDKKKFVFLFGEKDLKEFYPLDFKRLYGIDYTINGCKPIRIDEIQRIFVNSMAQTMSGNYFLAGILDYHKDLLTIREFGLSGFPYLYERLLCGRNIKEVMLALEDNKDPIVYNEFVLLFISAISDTPVKSPTVQGFFEALSSLFDVNYRPNKLEWFKGLFLAYSMALGRKFHQRIVPAIVFETHGMGVTVKPEDMYDIFRSFKYFRGITIIRRPTITLGARVDLFEKEEPGQQNYIEKISEYILDPVEELQKLYLDKNDEFLSRRGVVRFEDLKLYPEASLISLCEFLDIEWDENLLLVTANGVEHEMVLDAGKRRVSGFDPKPVYNLHENCFSPFDYYRIELVMEKYFLPWGYYPFYHKDEVEYSDDEIRKLFEVRFKCEQFHNTQRQIEKNEKARNKMYKNVNKCLKNIIPVNENQEEKIPITWIKPKKSLMEGEIYK